MAIEFLLIGSGWRGEFFIRLAKKLPERFCISAIVTTDEKKTEQYQKWGFYCVKTVEEGMKVKKPGFAVVSVNKDVIHQVAFQVLTAGLPVLSETPAASTYEALVDFFKKLPAGVKYQVAEQYHLRPDHAARLACIKGGKLGEPVEALISLTNNYHAISLMRKYLKIKGDLVRINGQRFQIPGKPGYERGGVPKQLNLQMISRTLAVFEFGSKYGLYNFEENQHRSFIRSQHIQIKCENGEINNEEVRYLKDRIPIYSPIRRINKGENENMEGSGLKGILFEGEWIYKNPYEEEALSDDETAVAECLVRMHHYCEGGPGFYGIADAAQDFYLALLLEEAVKTNKTITAEEQIWTSMLDEK